MIRVLLFANLRELAGTNQLDVDADGISCIADLLARIKHDHPALESSLDDESAMISVNQKYATREAALQEGDEVGILPPVSGG